MNQKTEKAYPDLVKERFGGDMICNWLRFG